MRPVSGPMRSARSPRSIVRVGAWLGCLLMGMMSQASLAAIPDAAMSLVPESLSLTTDAVAPRRFITVHGRRALLDGYADSGLEVWAYPVQLIKNYEVGFLPQGATSEIPGATILRRVVYRPDELHVSTSARILLSEKNFSFR